MVVSNLSARPNTVNALEMVKLVEINAPAVTAEIQNLGKLFRFL